MQRAAAEGIVAHVGHAVVDSYGVKVSICKRRKFHFRYRLRNYKVKHPIAVEIQRFAQRVGSKIAKVYAEPCREVGNIHVRKGSALSECVLAHALQTVVNRYSGNACAVEGVRLYFRNRFGNNYIAKQRAVYVHIVRISQRICGGICKFNVEPCVEIGNMRLFQSVAAIKRPFAHRGDAVAYMYVGERRAVVEGSATYACDAVGQHYLRDACAPLKGAVGYFLAAGDHHFAQAFGNTSENNAEIGVYGCVGENAVAHEGKGYALQRLAAFKSPTAYSLDVVGDGHSRQSGTICKGIAVYLCQSAADRNRLQRGTAVKRTPAHHGYAVGNDYGGKLVAIYECVVTYLGDAAVGGNDALICADNKRFACRFYQTVAVAVIRAVCRSDVYYVKTAAVVESICFYFPYTSAYLHLFQGGTTAEGTVAQSRNAVGDDDLQQIGAVLEGVVANFCHAG